MATELKLMTIVRNIVYDLYFTKIKAKPENCEMSVNKCETYKRVGPDLI
jgi:hypothetical protein